MGAEKAGTPLDMLGTGNKVILAQGLGRSTVFEVNDKTQGLQRLVGLLLDFSIDRW
jgi:hypothetical protein